MTMRKMLWIAILLISCETKEHANAELDAIAKAQKAAAKASAHANMGEAEELGVPECDDYIAKYEACVNGKVPELARAQFKASLKALRDSWRQAASTPQGKAGLAAGCKQATEQAKTAMKSYGCAF